MLPDWCLSLWRQNQSTADVEDAEVNVHKFSDFSAYFLSSDSTLGMRLLVITGIWICSAKISLGHTIIFRQPDILRTR
jgi:hypothetical protein